MVANLKATKIMSSENEKLTVVNNKLVVTSFKPRPVNMHGREDLENFRESAEATGIGLEWPSWRWSIEVGSRMYKDLVKKKAIPDNVIQKVFTQMGAVKKEPVTKLDELKEQMKLLGYTAIPTNLVPTVTSTATTTITATASTTVQVTSSTAGSSLKGFIQDQKEAAAATSPGPIVTSPVDSDDEPDLPMPPLEEDFPPSASEDAQKHSHMIDLTQKDYIVNPLSDTIMRALKISKEEMKRMSVGTTVGTRYIDLFSFTIEPISNLQKRIEMWEWLVACLRKGKDKGPYSHLSEQVNRYDVAGLYESIIDSIDIQNPFVFFRAFQDFIVAMPEKGEDIFSFFVRLEKLASGLVIRDPEEIGISDVRVVTDLALKLKMLDATAAYNEYKSFAGSLRTKKPSKWLKYDRGTIISELRTIHDNSVAMTRNATANQAMRRDGRDGRDGRNDRRDRGSDRGGRERDRDGGSDRGRSKSRGGQDRTRGKTPRPKDVPQGVCWYFWEDGKCSYQNCSFKHERRPKDQQQKNEQRPQTYGKPQENKSDSNPKCTKCGGAHTHDKCTFKGVCNYCDKPGHKAPQCRKKVADNKARQPDGPKKPNARLAFAEPERVAAMDDDRPSEGGDT